MSFVKTLNSETKALNTMLMCFSSIFIYFYTFAFVILKIHFLKINGKSGEQVSSAYEGLGK